MENILLICIGFILYTVYIEMPKNFKKLDDKMDILKLNLKEIELKLIEIDNKLNK